MTDKELLAVCQSAFEAIPVAARSRDILKKLGRRPVPYPGDGTYILSSEMALMIDEHLKGGL